MSHGQNQIQNAFGQNHETFEDFLFNSEVVKIVDAQICDRNDFLLGSKLGQSWVKVGSLKSLLILLNYQLLSKNVGHFGHHHSHFDVRSARRSRSHRQLSTKKSLKDWFKIQILE